MSPTKWLNIAGPDGTLGLRLDAIVGVHLRGRTVDIILAGYPQPFHLNHNAADEAQALFNRIAKETQG